jgi:phage shock protein PspC (stress-responsive transcriptional regulator)
MFCTACGHQLPDESRFCSVCGVGAPPRGPAHPFGIGPIYTNVVRMAMTPFFHGCLAGIFGYFIALAALDRARRWPLLVAGLTISATFHGLFDTMVPRSPLWGVAVEALTFFLLLTYVLKARGLTTASELTHGLWGSPTTPPAEEGPRTV